MLLQYSTVLMSNTPHVASLSNIRDAASVKMKISRNEPTDGLVLLSKQAKCFFVFQETLETKGNM